MNASHVHDRSPLPLRAIAACVLCAAIAVGIVGPHRMGELPSGMHTPVVAFELARTADEVERMFGTPGSTARAVHRDRMRLSVWLDYALLLGYGALLAALAPALARDRTPGRARLAAALAVAAAAFDALENRELLAILAALGGDYEGPLRRLAWFTWPKWLALGAYFVLLAPASWRAGRLWRAAALAGIASAASALVALPLRGVFAELMGLGVVLAISLLVVATLLPRRGPRAPSAAR